MEREDEQKRRRWGCGARVWLVGEAGVERWEAVTGQSSLFVPSDNLKHTPGLSKGQKRPKPKKEDKNWKGGNSYSCRVIQQP